MANEEGSPGPGWDRAPPGPEERITFSLMVLQRLDRLEQRLERLDEKIDGVRTDLEGKIDGLGKDLEGKIDGLGKHLEGKIDGLRKDLEGKIDGLRAFTFAWMVTTVVAVVICAVGIVVTILLTKP